MESNLQRGVDWRKLFARRGFRYFFSGMCISLFGSGMNFAGVTWYVLARTGSTVAVSWLLILLTSPGLFIPVIGGVLIDRLDRRYLCITIDLSRGLIVASTASLLYFRHAGVGAVYVMAFLSGTGAAIYWSSINALIQEVIPADELVGANSAVIIAVQGGLMIAGALVGFLYDRVGIAGILAIDAATYGASAFCLYRLRSGHFPPQRLTTRPEIAAGLAEMEETEIAPAIEAAPERNFFAELREGARFLREQPAVFAIGLAYASMIAGIFSGNILVVALTKDVLHANAVGYGAMEGGWAMGAILGGISAGALIRKFPLLAVLLGALGILCLGHLAVPYVRVLAAAVLMQGIFGACRAIGGILTQTTLMTSVPPRLMGRTQSTFAMLSTVLTLVISFSLGWLAERVSIPVAFSVLAFVYAIAFLSAWRAQQLTHEAAAVTLPG